MVKTLLKGVAIAGGAIATIVFTSAAFDTGVEMTKSICNKIDGKKKVEKKED
jgi:hypothetical protein